MRTVRRIRHDRPRSGGENSVIVRVAGPTTKVVPRDGCLDVGIVVGSEFARGHLAEVCLLPEDLADGAEALELLADGRPVCWMDDGRNPEVRITPKGPYISRGEALQTIEVVVRDTAVSLTSVCVRVPAHRPGRCPAKALAEPVHGGERACRDSVLASEAGAVHGEPAGGHRLR